MIEVRGEAQCNQIGAKDNEIRLVVVGVTMGVVVALGEAQEVEGLEEVLEEGVLKWSCRVI